MSYEVIYADPPWHYNDRKTGGERKNKTRFGGGAMKHYPLMKDSELVAMAPLIKSLAADNCALFMWATAPRLDFATDLIECWGFRYVTAPYLWVKTTRGNDRIIYGPGAYTGSNFEPVLLGVKGSMPVDEHLQPSVIICPRQRHSQKPNLYRRIERLYPAARKIELFARQARRGWDAYGNEVDSVITVPKRESVEQLGLGL